MAVGKRKPTCGDDNKKLEHIFHRVAHIFFINSSKYFCNVVDTRCVQKLFRNA